VRVQLLPEASSRGRSSVGRAPGRQPGRPVRSGSSASQVRGVTGSTASSNLAGPGFDPWRTCLKFVKSSRAGAARLSPGKGGPRLAPGRCGSNPLPDRTPRPRRTNCCGPERVRLSTPNRTVAGSTPARSSRAPVAQWQSSPVRANTTAAAAASSPPAAGRSRAVIGKSARDSREAVRSSRTRRRSAS
jgi:hypothetical protein